MPRKYFLIILGFSVAKLALHFAANHNYGLNADELYYIALSKHLQWGYLDNSPFIAFIAWASRSLFGESTFAYRIIPTVFSAITVFMTGKITWHIGGKTFAICAACTAMICSPAFLATSYFLQPIVFEHFFWTVVAFLFIRFIQTNKPVYLYGCALISGLGILNKYTIVVYLAALFTGYFFTLQKEQTKRIKHWIAAFALGFIIVLPNLTWQAKFRFPVFRYLSIVEMHNRFKGVGDYLFQFLFFHGAGMAVWLAGIGYLLFYKSLKPYRFIVISFLLTTVFFIVMEGKIYYALGAFPILFAFGGICWEKMLVKSALFWWYNLFFMLLLPALIALPIVLPIFPFPVTLFYFKLMTTYTSITQPLRWEDGKTHQISQFYADMFGWQEITGKTQQAVLMVDKTHRKNMVILTESYAVAGAISFYRNKNMPAVISADNSFILWSPQNLDAEYIVYISRKPYKKVVNLANHIMQTDRINDAYAHEKGAFIYLLHQPSNFLKVQYKKKRALFLGAKN